ncbi:glycosyltransferase [Algoriphagus sp. Y33]|uniref:glycosyltransferase n=1 Tax=Algoriphagus sp. Y33 TaxID=2772483 RepID=UPI00177FF7C3|nr:nucleotide disphospho-sugar-binding domain-containing protein [Algoriphagus sp. Y33]
MKKLLGRVFCTLLVVNSLSIWVIGQQSYQFRHLTTKDGLSNSNVSAVLKDSYGFLWIGMESGLNRYDGYGFKSYSAELGLLPAKNEMERAEYATIRDQAVNVMFKQAVDTFDEILKSYDIHIERSMLPNLLCREATLCLQIGTPGFEFNRIDLSDNIRFIGALLPYLSENEDRKPWFDERIKRYKKIILVTQGTFEKDFTKLTEPTLQAFKDTDVLVIVATAGNGTKELREKYASENIIIENFIPFNDVMPFVHVFVTNGGYGGTLLSIHNQVPMVAAGVHEGKIEICSRIGYFNYGVNLGTETPDIEAIRNAVKEVLNNGLYKKNIARLNAEMAEYNAYELCEGYIAGLFGVQSTTSTARAY